MDLARVSKSESHQMRWCMIDGNAGRNFSPYGLKSFSIFPPQSFPEVHPSRGAFRSARIGSIDWRPIKAGLESDQPGDVLVRVSLGLR